MIWILSRCKGIHAQLFNSSRRLLASSSNKGPTPDQHIESTKAQDPLEEVRKSEEAILQAKTAEINDQRKVFVTEELSGYEKLQKIYLERNANRYDSGAIGKNLDDEYPLERVVRVIKHDLKHWRKFFLPDNMSGYTASDFLIVGSGITASLLAYFLKFQVPRLEVTVLEEDPLVGCEPLGINGESLIMQWNMPHYIKMASFAFDFYHSLPNLLEDKNARLNFTPYGSLLLSSSAEDLDGRCSVYDNVNWKYERLSTKQLQASFPWMTLHGIEQGIHGLQSEGWVDPWKALSYVRRLSMSVGVNYTKGTLAEIVFNQVDEVDTEDRRAGEVDVPRIAIVKLPDGRGDTLDFSNIVLASGLRNRVNSRKLHIGNGPGFLGMQLPIQMRKRFMYRLLCPDAPLVDLPLIMDPSGFRIRREGVSGRYLCWRDPLTKEEEPDVSDLDVDESYFVEKIRPALIERVPAFKNARVESAWAGFVDENPFDGQPIIGLHPSYGNVFLITGLGSNELVFSPAIAKASAELLLEGEYQTVDCSAFLFDRVIFNDPIKNPNLS